MQSCPGSVHPLPRTQSRPRHWRGMLTGDSLLSRTIANTGQYTYKKQSARGSRAVAQQAALKRALSSGSRLQPSGRHLGETKHGRAGKSWACCALAEGVEVRLPERSERHASRCCGNRRHRKSRAWPRHRRGSKENARAPVLKLQHAL